MILSVVSGGSWSDSGCDLINPLVGVIDRSGDAATRPDLHDESMTLIDALLYSAPTAGTALGLFGVVVIVAGAVLSFVVDETHPALQSAGTNADTVQPLESVSSRTSDALMVAA